MRACLIALAAGMALASAAAAKPAPPASWLGAWQASPQAQTGTLVPIANRTLRERLTVAVAGRQVRVRLSNEYGALPLTIGAATIALADGQDLRPASIRKLTFGGAPGVVIAPGAPAFSDPVELDVAAQAQLAVSLYLPVETRPETYHRPVTNQDRVGAAAPAAILSPEGDFSRQARIENGVASPILFLSRVDVLQPRQAGAVVVLGTTRTAGEGHWPDFLARRLSARNGAALSVVNASAVANALTHPFPGGGDAGLARFDRDVLMVPGVTHVVLADAINDIGQVGRMVDGRPVVAGGPKTVEGLAAAYRQLVARAHDRGVKVIAATVMPFEGVPFEAFYSPEKEQVRQGLNDWIRKTGIFDGVLDLDAIMRDPEHPTRFPPGLETANHFGPNEAGERKIAEAIDLALFR